MSNTGRGRLRSTSPGQLFAVFEANGLQYSFSGVMAPGLAPFPEQDVSVSYNDDSDLTAMHAFNGQVGPQTLKFTLDNGAVIQATNAPVGIDGPTQHVDGTGQWLVN